jgi:type II secretory pathway pseudopilin PulG
MLEAVIATGIIVTAVSSALTLVSSSINAEKESEALLTAGNLAREGIEAVRSIRDSNWLAGRPFDDAMYVAAGNDYTGAPMFSAATNSWTIDFTPNAVTDARARVFRYTTGSGQAVVGLWVQAAAQPGGTVVTQYNRLLIMDPLCDNDAGGYTIVTSGTGCGSAKKIGVRVTSKVRWSLAGRVKTLDMEERLMDWR